MTKTKHLATRGHHLANPGQHLASLAESTNPGARNQNRDSPDNPAAARVHERGRSPRTAGSDFSPGLPRRGNTEKYMMGRKKKRIDSLWLLAPISIDVGRAQKKFFGHAKSNIGLLFPV
jgi:hypothetical protein